MTDRSLMAEMKPLPVRDEGRAQSFLDDLTEKLEVTSEARQFDGLCEEYPDAAACLKAILCEAPFLREHIVLAPDLTISLLSQSPTRSLETLLARTRGCVGGACDLTEADLIRDLRLLKREAALLIAFADLGRVWTGSEVTRALSDFADAALTAVIRFCLLDEARRGTLDLLDQSFPERGSGLVLLAMGKHGAGELNYSSDIDLIVFFDEDKVPVTEKTDPQTVMVRIAKRIVKLMQERTEHGYVFRTDLRLRPDPGATPLAISTEAALNYYESLGQNWERAAFIKARPVACDVVAADAFLQDLSPFIWRKYMDFAAIADVHAMKRQTHLHKGHGAIAMHGHNVKLGRGGIREIEFFVQTQQLIAGGRNPYLRARETVAVLQKLADAGWIEVRTAGELTAHYHFLRDVEHRIQMRRDEQTHLLPTDTDAFQSIAILAGFDTVDAFEDALLTCFQSVSGHYAKLFEEEEPLGAREGPLVFTGDHNDPDTLRTLEALGFSKSDRVADAIRGWHKGRYRAMRTVVAREALTQIMPRFIAALGRTANPDQAFFAFDSFLKSLPAGIQLFSLLRANRHLLDLLVTIMGSAPRLSEVIARRPHVFDALIDPALFGSTPTREDLSHQLQMFLSEAVDYQDVLDRTRIFTQEQKFLIGTRLLSGSISVEASQTLYAVLADAVTTVLLDAVQAELAKRHGVVVGGSVVLLAMGKLGGMEMTPTSDLDLILIYDVPSQLDQSNGERPLPVSQYYARLTQRFIAALSAPTGEGIAYEVDMRLRPSGKAGPLATHIDAFHKYQKESAWTWEHMALTRARPLAGDEVVRTRVEKIIKSVLTAPRDGEKTRRDVRETNERLHIAKTSADGRDIKTERGGLVDVEFIAQYMQLTLAQDNPEVLATNTGLALTSIAKTDHHDQNVMAALQKIYRLYSDFIQFERLCLDGAADPDRIPDDLANRLCALCDAPDINRLTTDFEASQKTVCSILDSLLGATTEGGNLTASFVSGATQP